MRGFRDIAAGAAAFIAAAAAAGYAQAQPGRPATVSVTLINNADVRVSQLTGDGGCNGTPSQASADPGRTASFIIYFAASCGTRSSGSNIKVWFDSGQFITCPPLYSQGGAYIGGQGGSYNCQSGPYMR